MDTTKQRKTNVSADRVECAEYDELRGDGILLARVWPEPYQAECEPVAGLNGLTLAESMTLSFYNAAKAINDAFIPRDPTHVPPPLTVPELMKEAVVEGWWIVVDWWVDEAWPVLIDAWKWGRRKK